MTRPHSTDPLAAPPDERADPDANNQARQQPGGQQQGQEPEQEQEPPLRPQRRLVDRRPERQNGGPLRRYKYFQLWLKDKSHMQENALGRTGYRIARLTFWSIKWYAYALLAAVPVTAVATYVFDDEDLKFPIENNRDSSQFPAAEIDDNLALGEDAESVIEQALAEGIIEGQGERSLTFGDSVPIGGGTVIEPEPPLNFEPTRRAEGDLIIPENLLSESGATLIITDQERHATEDGKIYLQGKIVDILGVTENNPLHGFFKVGQEVQVATSYRVSVLKDPDTGQLKALIDDGMRQKGVLGASGNPFPESADGKPLPQVKVTPDQTQILPESPITGYAVFVTKVVKGIDGFDGPGVIPHQLGGLVEITNFDGSKSLVTRGGEKATIRWDARALRTPEGHTPADRVPDEGMFTGYGEQLLYQLDRTWDPQDPTTWVYRALDTMHQQAEGRRVGRLDISNPNNVDRFQVTLSSGTFDPSIFSRPAPARDAATVQPAYSTGPRSRVSAPTDIGLSL